MNEAIKKQSVQKQIKQHQQSVKNRKTKSIKHNKPIIKKQQND